MLPNSWLLDRRLRRRIRASLPVLLAACFLISLIQPQALHSGHVSGTTSRVLSQRSGTASATITATVTDSQNKPVKDLPREAFVVLEKDEPLEITHFSAEDRPMSIGILFDLSPSVAHRSRSRLKPVTEHLQRLIELGHAGNEYFIEVFGSSFVMMPDWTQDRGVLARALNDLARLEARGPTALFDALHGGFEKVLLGRHPKRVLILISDGQDNSSQRKWNEIRTLVRKSDVLVYAIGIIDPRESIEFGGNEYGRNFLSELCSMTGGSSFFPLGAAAVGESLERIALELRQQYSIGFRPSPSATDGKWRKVKIRVTPPVLQAGSDRSSKPIKVQVRSREEYLAPSPTK